MKTRIAILIAVVTLVLLLGGVALARSEVRAPIAEANLHAPTQNYRLTRQTWQVSGVSSGGGLQLVSQTASALTGNGCCCTYVPLICR